MATLSKTVEIIFGGKDELTATVRTIERSLGQLETSVRGVTGPLADVGDAVLKVDAAIAALGVTAIAFAIGEAVKLESSQLDLQKVLSDSEGSVDQYTDTIRDLALQYGVMQTTVTDSAADFKQAGFSINESLNLVESSLVAVKISELDADAASQLLIATIKGFGFEASEATNILDTWNESSNKFATNTGEIARGLADLSPIARLAGLTLDETASLLIPVIEVFGSGTEAAIALKKGLLSMIDDKAAVTDTMDALGISQTNLNGTLKSAGEILFEVIGKFTDLDENQKLAFASQLVGINQAGRLSAVLDGENTILAAQNVLLEKTGSAYDELQIRLAAADLALQRVQVAFKNLQGQLGLEFLPATKDTSLAFVELLEAMRQVVQNGALDDFFARLNPIINDFNKTIQTIAGNLEESLLAVDFSGPFDSLDDLGGALGALFEGADLETAEGLTKVLQGLADIGEGLIRVTTGMFESYKPLFDKIKEGVGLFGNLSKESQQLIGNILGISQQVELLLPAFKDLAGALIGLTFSLTLLTTIKAAGALGAIGKAAGSLAATLGGIGVAGSLGWSIGQVASKFIDELIPGADTLGTKLFDLTHSSDNVTASFKLMGNAVSPVVVDINKFSDGARSAADSTGALNLAGNSLEDAFGNAGFSINATTGEVVKLGVAVNDSALSSEKAELKTESWVDAIARGEKTFSDGAVGIKNSYKITEDAAVAATDRSEDFLIKMEQIASDERIKQIDVAFKLDLAALQADTDIALGLIDLIGTSIKSTGELIGSLFGDLINADDRLLQVKIQRQLAAEEKRRAEAFKNEQLLVDAQIALFQAKAKAVESGEGLITITADGMEPQIEAFMWKILERIQIKAAADSDAFLLGVA